MILSIAYTHKASQVSEVSTFQPTKSPLIQIVTAKVILLFLVFLLGILCSQQVSSMLITIGAGLEFWITKNMARKYLQAAWNIDTSTEEQVWIYQANFKSPASYEEYFWYSQIIYGISLMFAAAYSVVFGKFSLLCAIIIAFTVNYVNFFAYSKIITLRNAGILEKIAQEANAEGEIREAIRLPLVYRSNSSNVLHPPIKSANQSAYV